MFLLPARIRSHPWLASRPPPIPEPRTRDFSEKTCTKVPEGCNNTPRPSFYTQVKLLRPVLQFAHKLKPKKANAPRIFNGYLLSGFAIIEVIPVEIVSMVTSYLALEESAALALTSKTMLSKIGRQSFAEVKRCSASRFRLLLQLEKEIYDMREILSHNCQVFHPPTSSIRVQGNINNGTRPCAKRSPTRRDLRTSSPYLPTTLHFNMVKAVMRSYKYGLNLYDPRELSLSSFFVDGTTNAKARYTATSVIADNQLLLRTVVTLLPSPIRGKARRAAPNLRALIKTRRRLRYICPHVEWSRAYPNIFADTPPGPRPLHSDPEQYPDAWNPRTKPKPWRGFYDHCKYCSTLIQFNYRDLEVSRARVVSLVSYKFLGKGEDFNDRAWVLHTQKATEEAKWKLRIGKFLIYPVDAWYRERMKLPEYGGQGANLDPFCFEGLDTIAS